MKKNFISVILPAFNASSWIVEALKSLEQQSYQNFEIIVIDDGSEDDTLRILQKTKNSKLKVEKNEKNLGLIQTLNKAFSLAQGDFIARMDADDRAHPLRFERQVRFFEKNPQISVLGTGIRYFSADPSWNSITQRPLIFPQDPEIIRAGLVFYSTVGHGTVMIKREVYEKESHNSSQSTSHFYNPDYPLAEDYELWTRLSLKGYLLTSLPEPLQEVRLHPTSVSRRENSLQIQTANRIRNFWRGQLGLRSDTESAEIHHLLGQQNFRKEKDFLEKVERCLDELLHANSQLKLFPDSVWLELLSKHWWHVLYQISPLFPEKKRKAIFSVWARPFDPFFFRAANLWIKNLRSSKETPSLG